MSCSWNRTRCWMPYTPTLHELKSTWKWRLTNTVETSDSKWATWSTYDFIHFGCAPWPNDQTRSSVQNSVALTTSRNALEPSPTYWICHLTLSFILFYMYHNYASSGTHDTCNLFPEDCLSRNWSVWPKLLIFVQQGKGSRCSLIGRIYRIMTPLRRSSQPYMPAFRISTWGQIDHDRGEYWYDLGPHLWEVTSQIHARA